MVFSVIWDTLISLMSSLWSLSNTKDVFLVFLKFLQLMFSFYFIHYFLFSRITLMSLFLLFKEFISPWCLGQYFLAYVELQEQSMVQINKDKFLSVLFNLLNLLYWTYPAFSISAFIFSRLFFR